MARSPKSLLSRLRYGVSPQPAQAPENSNSGIVYWTSLTMPRLSLARSMTGRLSKNWMFSRSWATIGSLAPRLMALRVGSFLFFLGQEATQTPQPVQSST